MKDLSLIKKAFEQMQTHYEKDFIEYERMYNSTHSKDFIDICKAQERNALFVPLTYSTINIAVAIFSNAFFSNGNPIELVNVGESDFDKKNELSQVVEYFFKRQAPYVQLTNAFFSSCIYGAGAVKVFWEDDAPKTQMIPINDLAFDSEALGIEDNNYICHRFSQTIQMIQEKILEGFYELKDEDKRLDFLNKDNVYERKKVYEIYKKAKDKYIVKTYCDDTLLREVEFRKCPIKHGMMLPVLPSVDKQRRQKQILCIGDSLVRIIKPLNEELNIKRNQRMDLIERHINPEIFVPISCGIDPDDALRVGGIKKCETTQGIMPGVNGAGAFEFSTDIAMLQKDIEDASSINGILRGNTNASDRRSQAALATVNANSNSRLESMIKLINETLFSKWAEDFVRLIYINAPDELITKIIEKPMHSLGALGLREELSFDIRVNFGQNFNKQQKISDLIAMIQMLGNNPNANVNGILEQILILSLGENVDAKAILGISSMQGDGAIGGEDTSGDLQDPRFSSEAGAINEADEEAIIQSQRYARDLELNQKRKNSL